MLNNEKSLDDQLTEVLLLIDTMSAVRAVIIPFPETNTLESQLWTIAGLHSRTIGGKLA
jgi:hypothetical protein